MKGTTFRNLAIDQCVDMIDFWEEVQCVRHEDPSFACCTTFENIREYSLSDVSIKRGEGILETSTCQKYPNTDKEKENKRQIS